MGICPICNSGFEVTSNRKRFCSKKCSNKENAKKAKAAKFVHGMLNSREYQHWSSMKNRCSNVKNYSYMEYGGRNIKVCSRWVLSFSNFYEDMGKMPDHANSICRINLNKNYSKSNCYWGQSQKAVRRQALASYSPSNGPLNNQSQKQTSEKRIQY